MVYVDSGGEEVLIGFNSSRLVGGEGICGALIQPATKKWQQLLAFREAGICFHWNKKICTFSFGGGPRGCEVKVDYVILGTSRHIPGGIENWQHLTGKVGFWSFFGGGGSDNKFLKASFICYLITVALLSHLEGSRWCFNPFIK